jgi:hypothetical protein
MNHTIWINNIHRGKKSASVLNNRKRDYSQILDVIRSLPIVPCFPHIFAPWILISIIYLDKAKLKANIQAQKNPNYKTQANFLHESSSPFIS